MAEEEEENSGGESQDTSKGAEKEMTLEEQIAAHEAAKPAPQAQTSEVITAPPAPATDDKKKTEEKPASSRSEFKKHFLGKGFLSGLIMNMLITVFAWGNAMVFNMVVKSKKIEDWRKLKPTDEEDIEDINDLIDLYAPKIMDYLDGLPDEVLMLCFIEYGFITRMGQVAVEVKPEKKVEAPAEEVKEAKKEEKTVDNKVHEPVIIKNPPPKEEKKPEPAPIPVEGHKLIFVITRAESPKYWKDDKNYTDNVAEAHHFDTGELADAVKNKNETVTTWKINKK